MREGAPTDLDTKMAPHDVSVHDTDVASRSTRADDSRDDCSALPQKGDPTGAHGSLSSSRGGYRGESKGSLLRGGRRDGLSTLAVRASSFPLAIIIAGCLVAPAAE